MMSEHRTMNQLWIYVVILLLNACVAAPHHIDILPLAPLSTEAKLDHNVEHIPEVDTQALSRSEQSEEPDLMSSDSTGSVPQTPLWPSETGMATHYTPNMEGLIAASGEPYDPEQLTAAHRTLPMGSQVRVTNLQTHRNIVVRINDRWSGSGNRIINLSKQAAMQLDFGTAGMIPVRLDVKSLPSSHANSADHRIQRLPAHLEENDATTHPRLLLCQNEANILGLTGAYFRYHVMACLSRSK
jgi:rare lipoprotein A (peptidoglycan hydrolase)